MDVLISLATTTTATETTSSAPAPSLSCQQLQNTEAAEKTASSTKAVLLAICLNMLQLLGALIVLAILNRSKRARQIFMPGRPDEIGTRGLMRSLKEALFMKAEERIPIDGHIIVRLCELGFKFFCSCTITSLILIPVYARGSAGVEGILQWSASNVTKEDGWIFHVTVVCGYVQVAVFSFLMHDEWRHYVKIRHRHFMRIAKGEMGPSAAQALFSLMVERVPKISQKTEAVRSFFTELFDGVHSCVLQRETSELHKIAQIEATTGMCSCCQSTMRHSVQGIVRLQEGVTRTARDTAEAVGSIAEGGAVGLRDVAGTGVNLMRNVGQNLSHVARWEDSTDEEQLEPTSTAFVTLNRLRDRLTAEQVMLQSACNKTSVQGDFKDWVIKPAPEARDIMWQNVALSSSEVACRSFGGVLLCFVGVSLWAIPVTAIQASLTTSNCMTFLPHPVQDFLNEYEVAQLILAYTPVVALIALLALLPTILTNFSTHFEGRKVKSEIVRVVLWRNLLFQLATLWATVFSGTLFDSIRGILDRPACSYVILGQSIPKVSVYFTSFAIARIGISLPMQILPPQSFMVLFKMAKQEPQQCYYETDAVNIAIVFVLGLMYSSVAPIIVPACMVYFGLATLVYRWKFLNVYSQEFDCSGAFFTELFTGVVIGLVLGLISVLGLAYFFSGANSSPFWAMLLLPIFAVSFAHYCRSRLAPLSRTMPFQDAVLVDRVLTSSVTAKFEEDYYKDPILKAQVPPDDDSEDRGSSEETSTSESDP